MDRAKVKVAFGGHIGYVCGDAEGVAELVDFGGGDGVVYCCEDEGGWFELGVFLFALFVGIEGGGGGGD